MAYIMQIYHGVLKMKIIKVASRLWATLCSQAFNYN